MGKTAADSVSAMLNTCLTAFVVGSLMKITR